MALLETVTQRDIAAEPNDVFDAIADYQDVHPRLLTEHFSEYEVREGGDGEGTVLHVRFQATSRRVRQLLLEITEPEDNTLIEKDRNSTLVTTWKVTPGDGGAGARVTVRTTWQGAGGVGGFFERLFAPRALAGIYDRILANLATEMEKAE
ncbi:SRPBCC family protein [Streptomyces sp. 8K308]|uniref:SRPBCC family protein n=1 Tax=Streptomyces sp. 8K308 TaxID=2530388 RepID=UPI00104D9928|nr:SRPBCC family protein [Streptomyces sp. 8K308]TDC09299.1 SRPBCC family protein [Streptomyces sp. 8K308]